MWGQHRNAVARVDARRFELLEDARHAPLLAIGDGVHVELDPTHELVHPQRPTDFRAEVGIDVARGPQDGDAPPADHPRGTDDDRQPQGRDSRVQPRGIEGELTARTLQAKPIEQLGEALAVLRRFDRFGTQPGDRHPCVRQILGQVDRRLPPEGQQDDRRLTGQVALVVDDVEHALGVEGLEIEPAARVVIGRDRFGVVVDDHRVEAHLADRPRRSHAAVVELDSLTDANRS